MMYGIIHISRDIGRSGLILVATLRARTRKGPKVQLTKQALGNRDLVHSKPANLLNKPF